MGLSFYVGSMKKNLLVYLTVFLTCIAVMFSRLSVNSCCFQVNRKSGTIQALSLDIVYKKRLLQSRNL